ncbi:hypothetical protein CVD28_23250 [Bacillus sp. M6-12]|uniref:hypothetical protein n=1 Tax=Bacillus sp. M6-12 TaxID=2054166 RepID=UPI000C76DC23|nr:hypothetical protein [Bacillus sp. M6-12]PLS15248.1 hypothetical protein CVD28_23250 [Bacillus sp. M6-12]
MQTVYAVELKHTASEFPELFDLLREYTDSSAVYRNFMIISDRNESDICKQISMAAQSFSGIHSLLKFAKMKKEALFTDYGFEADGFTFLFKESLTAFCFIDRAKEDTEMALLEMDEFLIASCILDGQEFFFAESSQTELILGLCRAYDIEVSFLNLDKY